MRNYIKELNFGNEKLDIKKYEIYKLNKETKKIKVTYQNNDCEHIPYSEENEKELLDNINSQLKQVLTNKKELQNQLEKNRKANILGLIGIFAVELILLTIPIISLKYALLFLLIESPFMVYEIRSLTDIYLKKQEIIKFQEVYGTKYCKENEKDKEKEKELELLESLSIDKNREILDNFDEDIENILDDANQKESSNIPLLNVNTISNLNIRQINQIKTTLKRDDKYHFYKNDEEKPKQKKRKFQSEFPYQE